MLVTSSKFFMRYMLVPTDEERAIFLRCLFSKEVLQGCSAQPLSIAADFAIEESKARSPYRSLEAPSVDL